MEEKNKQEITLDSLALIIANRFDEMDERMKKGFEEIKADTEDIKANLNKKVDVIEYNTLDHRVEKLEEKFV